jgi:hypothetical protein
MKDKDKGRISTGPHLKNNLVLGLTHRKCVPFFRCKLRGRPRPLVEIR